MSVRNLTSRRLATSNVLPVGGVVSPLSLPGLVSWWDCSSATYMATATNGTGAVSNGSTVAYLQDRSGNGWHLTQATANNRPTFASAGIGGTRGSLSFNGTTSFLASSATSALSGDVPFTAFAVYLRSSATSGLMMQGGVQVMDVYASSFGNNRALASGGTSFCWTNPNQTTATAFVMVYTSRSGPRNCNQVWRNGALVQSYSTTFATVSLPSSNSFALGGLLLTGVGNLYLNGQVGEAGFYNRELSVTEVVALGRMLGSPWGVTVA